jgi:serine protease
MEARAMRRALLMALGILGAAWLFAAGAQGFRAENVSAADSAPELLPDLDQETPSELTVEAIGSGSTRTYRLGFRSAVRNIGDGPLILDGARPDTSTPYMTVNQVVERGDAPQEVIPAVGRMVYAVSPDHQHWHYLQFDRYELQSYELRRAASERTLVRDRKTGFCLGDRYRVTTRLVPNAAPEKFYRGRCGLTETELLQMHEGISVGYGDAYSAFLEGQDLPLSGLAGGRYVLVHRVNGNRHLRELSYANNAASVLFELRWRTRVPYLRVLRTCPDTDRCDRRPLAAVHPAHTSALSGAAGKRAARVVAHAASTANARAAHPFIPDDGGLIAQPGGWGELQWNFSGPFGVDAPDAWTHLIDAGRPGGAGVIVAVLDTGIAYADQAPYRRSPDLSAASFAAGYDFVDDDAYPFDLNGHGTHVASTIAEQTDNEYGLTGLAYGVRLMPVRVLDEFGNGYPATIARGIRFAADHHAKVINLSLNFGPGVRAEQIPQVIRAMDYAYKRGSLVVAAAGNGGIDEVAYPARAPHVVAVGATTENGCLSSFSNVGSGLDLVAPGGGSDAYLADDANCRGGRAGRPIYQSAFLGGRVTDFEPAVDFIGTSMATAHVSATAALTIASGVVGTKPTPTVLQRRLQRTARDLGSTGYDDRYGWGLVNAAAATARGTARRPVPIGPPTTPGTQLVPRG